MPEHLRNTPARLMKTLGYGRLYRYAHDEPEAFAAGETYLSEGMAKPHWHQPTPRGLESKIEEKQAFGAELEKAELIFRQKDGLKPQQPNLQKTSIDKMLNGRFFYDTPGKISWRYWLWISCHPYQQNLHQ